MPKDHCGRVGWSRHRKDGVPKKLCGLARWPRHRKDGAPKKLCGSASGGLCAGKMVCLTPLWFSKWWSHRKDGVPKKLCGPVRWPRHRKDVCLRNFVAQ